MPVGYLPALPSRPAPLEVLWGLPCPTGGIIGLSGGAQCHPPTHTRGEARGHSPAARPRRWSPPSPCSQQDPAKRARRGDSSQPSSDPINGPSRGRIPGLGVLLASSPQPLPCLPLPGAYRLALGSCHPRVAPLALWSLGGRKKKNPGSAGSCQQNLEGGAQLKQNLMWEIGHFCQTRGVFALIPPEPSRPLSSCHSNHSSSPITGLPPQKKSSGLQSRFALCCSRGGQGGSAR